MHMYVRGTDGPPLGSCNTTGSKHTNIAETMMTCMLSYLSPYVVDGVDSPGVEQNTLGESSFSTIDVGGYADVSRFRYLPRRRRVSLRHL